MFASTHHDYDLPHIAQDNVLSTAAQDSVAVVDGYVQMLCRWEAHEAREVSAFATISRQCDRTSGLAQELLEVWHLYLGRLELRKHRFDLGELAAEMVERMQATTTKRRWALAPVGEGAGGRGSGTHRPGLHRSKDILDSQASD